MKKTIILIIIVLFMVIGYAAYNTTINIYGNGKLAENLSDFNVYLSNLKVNGKEVSGINNTKDEFTINDINGDISVDVINDSTEYDTESYLECVKEDENVGKVWNYDYTGGEQTFTVPTTGTYKLETWGAQGGYVKGVINSDEAYGGYSVGNVILSKDINLYIQVGGMGLSYDDNKSEVSTGNGYNGGGTSSYQISSANNYYYGSGGGGATHVATISGLLESLNNNIDKIIMVSGGGGGSSTSSLKVNNNTTDGIGGSGGGYIGTNGSMLLTYPSELVKKFNDDRWYGTGGNQVSGGGSQSTHSLSQLIVASFGKGCTPTNSFFSSYMKVSGGGGFYGGGCGTHSGGGGGSGYIGNSLLTEKTMYCYNCAESSEKSIKTISTTCVNLTSTENCAKQGNGYARITLISAPTNITTNKVTIIAQERTSQSLKNITGKSISCKLKIKKISRTEKKVYNGPTEWMFDYTGGEQVFTSPITGSYKLEVWGAQGGSLSTTYYGGYGGYSSGKINIKNSEKIYINIGGQGSDYSLDKLAPGGYNGGGYGGVPNTTYSDRQGGCGGGGATHIAITSGLLSSFENKKEGILIVAGGGGGGASADIMGSDGGGYKGNDGGYSSLFPTYHGTGGTQTIGGFDFTINSNYGTFGQGSGFSDNVKYGGNGGGGGFYGGGGTNRGHSGGGGGSGYIGNSLLTEKAMYCYNCQESSEESTKTISTTCTSATPTANCAKQGNGYAKITLISLH